MRLRPRHRNLVVWNSSAVPAGGPAGRGRRPPTRISRIRWWLRVGVLLIIIGVRPLARTTRIHWEPVSLLGGTALTVTGFLVPAVGVFFAGLLVLVVTLLRGIGGPARPSGGRRPG